MNWFRRRRNISLLRLAAPPRDDTWITVPFRYAEAARVSIHTIGNQPGIPVDIKYWISQWLAAYNQQLVRYMRAEYGPDIFPLLDEITRSVMPPPDGGQETAPREHWEKWEKQLRDEGEHENG